MPVSSITIDDRPDAPVATPAVRRSKAIHWEWTTDYTHEEMAAALGVSERTIRNYINEGPGEEVREVMADVEAEVRMVAVAELKAQLQQAGHRSRTAESVAEVWQDDTGDVHVREVTDDDGDVVKRVPVPADYDLLPNDEARYYARAEVRDILDQLTDLVGAGEPDRVEHTGEGGGAIQVVSIREAYDPDGDGGDDV